MEKSGDDRLVGHPMCLEKHWRSLSIPLMIHGDGVEYENRDTLLVYSWGSMLAQMPSLKQHWLLGCFPKSCTSEATWPPIWDWLKWSFEALGKGYHPSKDPWGKPLEKGSILYDLQGQPLHCKGYRAWIFNIQGDHEFYSNVLKLPHWASKWPCWECDAENFAGCSPAKYYKEICLEKQDFVVTSHAEHLSDPWSSHPVFQLPHVSAKNVRGDAMHILFCKGIHGHLLGGILHYACFYEGPGKVSAIKPSERLGLIFEEVQAQYKEQLLENRLTNLKLSMFTDPKSPWASRASLDCKAGESKHLLPALVPVLEKMFEGTTKPEELHMLSAASSLEKLVSLWDAADLFLTEEQFAQSLTLGKEFLDSYKWLNSWSLEKGRNSFGIVAKFHTFIHLLWNCQFANPRGHWNFRGEDFVGHMSKMAHSVSFGVSSCKISQKLAQKYRLLVHFLLSREMEMDELDHLLDN